jgi:hypothetical protein
MAKQTVAGRGSNIDPKKSSNRNASGYDPHEKVNEGPNGGKKGKSMPGHGQNSDAPDAKDSLVPQVLEQRDPYKAKPTDFPVKNVMAATGQSGAHGFAEGHNELASYTENQCGPRFAEDDGMGQHGSGTPVPGNRGERVAANFPIKINDGEGSSDTTEMGIAVSVNLMTGRIEGGSVSRVYEVPQHDLHIPPPMKKIMGAGKGSRD